MTDTGAPPVPPAVDALLDRAPCGFVTFGDDGRIALVNTTLAERLGYRRDELVGRHVETLFTVPGRLFYQTHFFPLVRLHGRAQEVFLMLRAKGGEDVGVLCNAVRRPRETGYVTECVMLEVVERRKYEDALLQAKRTAESAQQRVEAQAHELEAQHAQMQDQAAELEAQAEALQTLNQELHQHAREMERLRAAADDANRAKSTFLAVMSHELRTPLNAIAGYLQLLEMEVHGPLTKAQRDAVLRIDRNQRHLLRLINDVLNLARIESGRVDYRMAPFAIAEAVASVLPMVEPQAAARSLRLTVDVPDHAMAYADREKVEQILLNLLTNAVKFTGAGGEVGIAARPPGPAADVVEIDVRDTGMGIPADMRERIFEPFIQVDSSRTRSSEGTGLGLAISRDMARGMLGELRVESEPGEGSTFTLTLRASKES